MTSPTPEALAAARALYPVVFGVPIPMTSGRGDSVHILAEIIDRHFAPILAERDQLQKERDRLAQWQAEKLIVEKWWEKIDAFVRSHPDAALGRNVSAIALQWLKERDGLREKAAVAQRLAVALNRCANAINAGFGKAQRDHIIAHAEKVLLDYENPALTQPTAEQTEKNL